MNHLSEAISFAGFVLKLALVEQKEFQAPPFEKPTSSAKTGFSKTSETRESKQSIVQILLDELTNFAIIALTAIFAQRLMVTSLFLLLIAPLLLRRSIENRLRQTTTYREDLSSFIYTMH